MQSDVSLKAAMLSPASFILPLATIVGTLLGGLVVSQVLDLSLKNALAVSSGFGWYTLSGVMFTEMNEPILASIAFISDLFREVIALILIPILSRKNLSYVAIGAAGATSLDVTLPVIEKHCGSHFVPASLISGGVLTILVPVLIPFFYYI